MARIVYEWLLPIPKRLDQPVRPLNLPAQREILLTSSERQAQLELIFATAEVGETLAPTR